MYTKTIPSNSYSSLEYEKNIKLEGSQGILQLAVSCDHWVAREMDATRYISWSIQYHPKRTDAWNSTSTFMWLCRSRWCWQICPFLVSSVKPFFHRVCRDTQDSHSLQTPHGRCYDTGHRDKCVAVWWRQMLKTPGTWKMVLGQGKTSIYITSSRNHVKPPIVGFIVSLWVCIKELNQKLVFECASRN